VARHHIEPTADLDSWKAKLRERFGRQQKELDLPTGRACEVFTVTAWGTVPKAETLLSDFPGLCMDQPRLERLKARLARWG
jgi:hypothetical protein